MKNLILSFFSTACIVVAILSLYLNTQAANQYSEVELANIEALSQTETQQPDVADCIEDRNYHCEALHPTDPKKDKIRYYARWN